MNDYSDTAEKTAEDQLANSALNATTYRPIRFVSVGILLCLAVYITIVQILRGNYKEALYGPASFLFLLIPPIVEKLFKINLGNLIFAFGMFFVIFGFQLGTALHVYDRIFGYDKIMHVISGVLFTLCGFIIFRALDKANYNRSEKIWLQIFFAFAFSMMIAVLWEVYEFTAFNLTGNDMQHTLDTGVFDTMQDLISCIVGSLIMSIDFYIFAKKGKKTPISRMISDFDSLNPPKE